MALKIHDFRCPVCGHKQEALVNHDEDVIRAECGHAAHRVVSAPKLSYRTMGLATGMTTADDKWARMHVEQAKLESKREYG